MGDYNRSTRECTFEQLRPEIIDAMRMYAKKHGLWGFEPDIVMCVETTSEKKKTGMVGGLLGGDPDPVHYLGIVLTPRHMIWARSGKKYGKVVLSAALKEIEVKDFASPLVDDTGLEVYGFVEGAEEKVTAFIELDDGLAAQIFKERLKSAITQASGAVNES